MIKIPIDYINSITKLSDSCAIYGYQKHYINWHDCVQTIVSNNPNAEIGLFFKQINKENLFLIEEGFAKFNMFFEKNVVKKWMYIVLHWIYDNRKVLSDPLGLVEEVYCEFDYPEEIEEFVRYMPVKDSYNSSVHSLAENEERLFGYFKHFLDSTYGQFNL